MGTGVITILAMLAFSYVVWQCKSVRRLLGIFIYGQMYFWSTYILISALLMWLDIYRIWYATIGTLLVALAVFFAGYIVYGKKQPVREEHKIWDGKDAFVLLLCILMAVGIHDKNELYGMSQDEGAYQTIAISYMMDNNVNQKTLEEYETLGEEDKAAFLDKLNHVISQGMHDYYLFCGDYIPRNMQERYSETSGYYHGVPTYAATLALWGRIFGWKCMMGVQSLFYILAVLLFYELIRERSLSTGKQMLLLTIYSLSPIMIWLGKSSLTELLLACFMNWFLCELLSKPSRNFKAIQVSLPIIAFAFVHLSIYTLMPMIIVCLLIRFWDDRNAVFLKTGLYISAGYFAGILFTAWCYTEYFYLNVRILTRRPIVNDENVLAILGLCGGASALLFCAFYFYKKRLPQFSMAQQIWGLRITAGIFTAGSIWIIVKTILTGGQWEKLTIVSYVLLTGIVTLPVILVFLIVRTNIFCLNRTNSIITWFFLYCVLFYATLFRREIINHYYGDRYLAPFLVGVLLMMGIVLEHIPVKRFGRYLTVLCGLIALGYLIGRSTYIIMHKDDTRIEWDFLEQICEKLDKDDVVILEDYHMISCFFPIRDMTGAYCYPVFGEDIQETVDKLMSLEREIYILAGNDELPQDYEIVGEWQVSYYEYAGVEKSGLTDPLKMVDSSFVGVWRLVRFSVSCDNQGGMDKADG